MLLEEHHLILLSNLRQIFWSGIGLFLPNSKDVEQDKAASGKTSLVERGQTRQQGSGKGFQSKIWRDSHFLIYISASH